MIVFLGKNLLECGTKIVVRWAMQKQTEIMRGKKKKCTRTHTHVRTPTQNILTTSQTFILLQRLD